MTTLVIGATGNVGPHVVAALRALDARVRVLVRDGGQAASLLGSDVGVISGDAADEGALDRAADGVDSVFLLTPHSDTMADLQLRVIRQLRRRPVRIVKLSATSPAIRPDGPLVARQHWEVEQILSGSGQPYVILRPNTLMQTLVGQSVLGPLKATGVIHNPVGDAGISIIDAQDVGAVAARVLTSESWDGHTLILTGPRPVSLAQIGELLSEHLGKSVPVVDVTLDQLRASLLARGLPAWEADHVIEMQEIFRAGDSAFTTTTVEELTGQPAHDVADYLSGGGTLR